jgi:lipopolysaccharide assembly protein A
MIRLEDLSYSSRVGAPTSVDSSRRGIAVRSIQAAIFLVFLVTIGIFAVQNRDVITVSFLAWKLSQPVAVVTVAFYILGMLSGWTVLTFARGTFRRATASPQR